MEDTQVKEIRTAPSAYAYVRSGIWADKSWRVINAELGIDTNNAEPLELKNAPGEFDRKIFMTFDLSEFQSIDFKRVFFFPSFIKVDESMPIHFALYEVDADAWNTDTLTYNTMPEIGRAISENNLAGGITKVELTDVIREALAAGKTCLSFAIIVTTEGEEFCNRINPKIARLAASTAEKDENFVKALFKFCSG